MVLAAILQLLLALSKTMSTHPHISRSPAAAGAFEPNTLCTRSTRHEDVALSKVLRAECLKSADVTGVPGTLPAEFLLFQYLVCVVRRAAPALVHSQALHHGDVRR